MGDMLTVVRTRSGFRIFRDSQIPSGVRVQEDRPLMVGRGTVIEGGVFLAGSLYTQPRVRFHGPIRARGGVVLGAGSVVAGAIEAESDIRLLPGVVVHRGVTGRSDVHLFDGAVVHGPVAAGGDIVIWGGAETGPLHPGGRIRTEPFPRGLPSDPGPAAPAIPTDA